MNEDEKLPIDTFDEQYCKFLAEEKDFNASKVYQLKNVIKCLNCNTSSVLSNMEKIYLGRLQREVAGVKGFNVDSLITHDSISSILSDERMRMLEIIELSNKVEVKNLEIGIRNPEEIIKEMKEMKERNERNERMEKVEKWEKFNDFKHGGAVTRKVPYVKEEINGREYMFSDDTKREDIISASGNYFDNSIFTPAQLEFISKIVSLVVSQKTVSLNKRIEILEDELSFREGLKSGSKKKKDKENIKDLKF
jgi:hypothetical protein